MIQPAEQARIQRTFETYRVQINQGNIDALSCPTCHRPLKFELHGQGAVYYLTCGPCGVKRWGIVEPNGKTEIQMDEEEPSGE